LSISGRFIVLACFAMIASIVMVAVGFDGLAEDTAEICFWLVVLELLSSFSIWILRIYRDRRKSTNPTLE